MSKIIERGTKQVVIVHPLYRKNVHMWTFTGGSVLCEGCFAEKIPKVSAYDIVCGSDNTGGGPIGFFWVALLM